MEGIGYGQESLVEGRGVGKESESYQCGSTEGNAIGVDLLIWATWVLVLDR